MSTTPMKKKILSLLYFARQEEEWFVDKLSAPERASTGTAESWAARDFLVNITLWKELQTQKLAMAERGEEPPVWRDMELVHTLNSVCSRALARPHLRRCTGRRVPRLCRLHRPGREHERGRIG